MGSDKIGIEWRALLKLSSCTCKISMYSLNSYVILIVRAWLVD